MGYTNTGTALTINGIAVTIDSTTDDYDTKSSTGNSYSAIAISGAMARGNLLALARKLGAASCLEKPFAPQDLLQAVEALAA